MTGFACHTLRGSPREVGLQLGRLGASAVHGYLTGTVAWADVMSRRADPRLPGMADLVVRHFPTYADEIRGLAEGLGLPFDDVFAWNCRGDLWAMAPDGCTTVQVPGPDRRVVAHNEDGLPGFAGRCFMVRLEQRCGPTVVSFAYPGSLPGHTFAMNAAGLIQAVNNVRATDAAVGVPRMVLGRAVLDARDLDGAVAGLKAMPRAGGFHMTLAQAGDPRILSVEFLDSGVSAVEIGSTSVHSNHIIHAAFAHRPQVVTASSAARQARGEAMLADFDGDPLSILWDRAGGALPLLRQAPDDPDAENLMATAVFTLAEQDLSCRVYEPANRDAASCFGRDLEMAPERARR
jgi:hypothetical protein